MHKRIIPLSQRPGDIAILVFFFVNILCITYVVDLEQLVIANPAHNPTSKSALVPVSSLYYLSYVAVFNPINENIPYFRMNRINNGRFCKIQA